MAKIIFVSNTSRSLYNLRLRLMELMKKRGFDIVLCASCDECTKKLMESGFRLIPVRLERKGTNPFRDLKLIYDLYKIYKEEKPDIVLHFSIKINIYGTLAAKLTKVQCMSTITGLGYAFLRKNILSKFVKILYRFSFKFPSRIFFQNKDDLEFFVKNEMVDINRSILIKGSGVDISYYCPEFCKEVKKDTSNFTFLYLGRILWDKGIGELVSAFKIVRQKYSNTRLWLLGRIDKDNPSGVSEGDIRKWEREGVVKYLGSTNDVRPFICKSDTAVLPSYREGTPRSLLEAMAMGKPIITTNAVGCKEVVEEDFNGYSVPVKDTEFLAKTMIKLIELSPEKREELGNSGRKKAVEEFDENDVIGIYLKTIEDVIEDYKVKHDQKRFSDLKYKYSRERL